MGDPHLRLLLVHVTGQEQVSEDDRKSPVIKRVSQVRILPGADGFATAIAHSPAEMLMVGDLAMCG
jgi:hypothetical protein